MDENLYLSWGNSYIQISEGKMTVKHKGSILMNGVIGGMQTYLIELKTICYYIFR